MLREVRFALVAALCVFTVVTGCTDKPAAPLVAPEPAPLPPPPSPIVAPSVTPKSEPMNVTLAPTAAPAAPPATAVPATTEVPSSTDASELARQYNYAGGYSIVPPAGWDQKAGKPGTFLGLFGNLVIVVESAPSPTAVAHLEKSLPSLRTALPGFKELGRSELQIDGKPALSMVCTHSTAGVDIKAVIYMVSNGNKHVWMIFSTTEKDFDAGKDEFKIAALTFRFARPGDPPPPTLIPSFPEEPEPESKVPKYQGAPPLTWHVPDGKKVSERVVKDLKFNPSGIMIASATDAENVIVWSATTGKPIRTLKSHTKYVNAVDYSPDGKLLVSASDDSTICVWDLSSGKRRFKLERQEGFVNDVAFSPDGKQLASCSIIGDKVHLWDAIEGKHLREFGHSSEIVAFDREGKLLAITKSIFEPYGTNIELWDTATGKLTQTLTGHTNDPSDILFSTDNKTLISCAPEAVIFWDLASGKQNRTIPSRSLGSRLALSPNGKVLAFVEFPKLRFLDATTTEDLLEIALGIYPLECLTFSSDGKRLATGYLGRDIRIWDLSTALPAASAPAKTP